MKIVVREGVFETNSSSTHNLVLVSKKDYEADKAQKKPKYRHYGVLDNKEDKLRMACGCCDEMLVTEEDINRYASYGGEGNINRKKEYDEIKDYLTNGLGDYCYMWYGCISYELAVSLIARVYCELTGKNYDKTYDGIIHNTEKRMLHMKFFDEGALNDSASSYMIIADLFQGDESEVLSNIRRYFDDDNVLCYIEYYAGIHWDEDDDE